MESDSCVTYNSADNIIRISCGFVDLTDINNQLKDPDLLHKEMAKKFLSLPGQDSLREEL
jgi:hypothetical protein